MIIFLQNAKKKDFFCLFRRNNLFLLIHNKLHNTHTMKDFIKFTFASLLGVLLAGIVFAILGIVSMVGMMATSDTETVVKENSIFMKSIVLEQASGTFVPKLQTKDIKFLVIVI